jgi:malonate transporter
VSGVLTSFAVIWVVVGVGVVCGRRNVLGEHGGDVIGRLVFSVFLPALLFSVVSTADIGELFSLPLLVQTISAAVAFGTYVLVARLWWKPSVPETVIGGLSASYVNGNNLGLPIALYILGDASLVVPIMLFQLVVFAPICLAVLDATTGTRTTVLAQLRRTFLNPILIATIAAIVVALAGWDLPEAVSEPFVLLGAAAVPSALVAFGIRLSAMGQSRGRPGRHDTLLAVGIKLVLHPLVAYALAAFVFDLGRQAVYAAVIFAALPTAQNVFNYANRYQRGRTIATNTTFVTTLAALPLVVVISLLLDR